MLCLFAPHSRFLALLGVSRRADESVARYFFNIVEDDHKVDCIENRIAPIRK